MLFDVSTGSWKNISDGLDFVTQTWRWPTNVMIQTQFTVGVDLSVKGQRSQTGTKITLA